MWGPRILFSTLVSSVAIAAVDQRHQNSIETENAANPIQYNSHMITSGNVAPNGFPLIGEIQDLLKTSVFVSNMDYKTTVQDLRDLMKKCGKIKKCDLLMNGDDIEDENKRGKFKGD